MLTGKFFKELRRRNIVKAVLSYLAVSWVVLQAASIIFPILAIDPWYSRLVLAILVVGFPIWLILAWIYDFTIEGITRTEDLDRLGQPHRSSSGRRLDFVIIAGLGIAVSLLLADRYLDFTGGPAQADDKSIAVLAFENMSDGSDDYFTLGITEDILTQISKIGDLKVLSRFTLKEYDASGKTSQQIGQELNVGHLLVGSVRRLGNDLRIGCQLINTKNQIEVWAHTFDRKMSDVFAIQSEVAKEIAANLKARLTMEEKTRISLSPTADLKAYNYYLKGREEYTKYSGASNEEAIGYFKQALELDDRFALASAGLSDAYAQAVSNYGNRPYTYLDSAFDIALMATRYDPEAAETWKALGLSYQNKGDLEQAKRCYRQSLEKNPNYSPAVSNLGLIFKNQGELLDALTMYKKSASINPLQAYNYAVIAEIYQLLEMYPEALSHISKAEELSPNNWYTLYYGALVNFLVGQEDRATAYVDQIGQLDTSSAFLTMIAGIGAHYFDDDLAMKYFQRSLDVDSYDPNINWGTPVGIGYIFMKQGKEKEANVFLDQSLGVHLAAIKSGSEDANRSNMLGCIYAIKGEKEESLKWLEKMHAQGYQDHVALRRDPWLSLVSKDERFVQIIDDMGSSVQEMKSKLEEGS